MSDRNHMSGKKKTINRTSKKQENVRQRDARIKAEVRKSRRNQTVDTRKRRAMKAQRKREKANNKPVVVISYLFLMLFIGMIGYFADYMINESEHTKDVMSSESASILEKNVIRGNILSAEGHVLAMHSVHVRRGSTEVGDDAVEIRQAAEPLYLAEDRSLGAGYDLLALMGRDSAEGAAAETTAMHADGPLDHLVGEIASSCSVVIGG